MLNTRLMWRAALLLALALVLDTNAAYSQNAGQRQGPGGQRGGQGRGQQGPGGGQRGPGQGQRGPGGPGQGQRGPGGQGQRGPGGQGQGQGSQRGPGGRQGQGPGGQGQRGLGGRQGQGPGGQGGGGAQGQGPGQRQQQGQNGSQQQQQRQLPLIIALDANGDTIISPDEIANAYQRLKTLDRNKDGRLTPDEFRPAGAPAGPGGPPQGGPGGGGPGLGGPGGPGMGAPGGQRGPGGASGPGQGRGQAGPGPGQRGPGQGGQAGPGGRGQGQGGPGGPGGQGRPGGPTASAGHGGGEVEPRDQPDRPRDISFRNAIEVGKPLPAELQVYNTAKQRIPMKDLFRKDRYTVVVCGCLTCPAFLNAYKEVEAVYADYQSKVDFYFMYHVLAHPENRGYIQPMNIDERFMHIAEAKRTLGTNVPWIADTMENEVKELYVFASNPEFIFAPDGKVVHREPWSRGTALRAELEKLVGPAKTMTKVADLKLPDIERVSEGDRSGIVERVQVRGMAVPVKFEAKKSEKAWFAKMRPEVDRGLSNNGTGQMYLGFHLDPIHKVQWNNLAAPLKYELTGPDGTKISPASGKGSQPKAETDGDPREFIVDIENWTDDAPLTLTVSYVACSKKDNSCTPVRQEYQIFREANDAAGRVNGRSHMAGGQRGQGGGGGRGPGGAGRGQGGGGGRGPGGGGQGQRGPGGGGRGPGQGGR